MSVQSKFLEVALDPQKRKRVSRLREKSRGNLLSGHNILGHCRRRPARRQLQTKKKCQRQIFIGRDEHKTEKAGV